ncbi:MAG: class C sortase [Ruminococcus sp.]|nr:class C sortase [Ruminococcus sp.]
MNKKFIRIISYAMVVVLFLFGFCIYIYPIISANIAGKNLEVAIDNFEKLRNNSLNSIEETSESMTSDKEKTDDSSENIWQEDEKTNKSKSGEQKFDELYDEMQKYNNAIYKDGQKGLCDAWSYEQSSVNLSEYGIYDGVVGVLRVPKMNDLKMPIYLGASYYNMSRGATQLGETSMPIGGKNTNCVLAGHRGWSGARYFLDIEQMQLGDKVYIDNLWTTLTYEVSDIKIIYPDDIDSILIQENKDMVTLITCHPYWASTYRYAVFCTRTSDDENSQNKSELQNNQLNSDSIEITDDLNNTDYTDKTDDVVIKNDGASQFRIFIEGLSYLIIPLIIIVLFILLRIKNK